MRPRVPSPVEFQSRSPSTSSLSSAYDATLFGSTNFALSSENPDH